jgi:hypothetical protein
MNNQEIVEDLITGSSKKTIFGFPINAMATESLLLIPPE